MIPNAIPLMNLWLPILVSAVFVFVVSAVLHMAINYHKNDYRKLPDEEGVVAKLRAAGVTPGVYHFPYCTSGKEMRSPEVQEKFKQGPIGLLTIMPSGLPNMGKYLGLWFLYTLLVSGIIGCLAGRMLAPGAIFNAVFHFTATIAFLTYGVSPLVDSIWRGQPWSNTLKTVLDGVLYALAAGAAFAWLWPR
ncbi:MAG: hypothetical protein ABI639_12495 [Thermoanaerobaculia bacterium]